MKCALTLFGRDKPGIISSLTNYLSSKQLNVEDASMTILEGQFAMILVADIRNMDPEEIKEELDSIDELQELNISISPEIFLSENKQENSSALYILHLTSKDSIGIVAKLTQLLSSHNVNIVDCSTRKNLEHDLFTLILDAQVPLEVEEQIVTALGLFKSDFDGDFVFRRADDVEL